MDMLNSLVVASDYQLIILDLNNSGWDKSTKLYMEHGHVLGLRVLAENILKDAKQFTNSKLTVTSPVDGLLSLL
jgi:hypothetical protein